MNLRSKSARTLRQLMTKNFGKCLILSNKLLGGIASRHGVIVIKGFINSGEILGLTRRNNLTGFRISIYHGANSEIIARRRRSSEGVGKRDLFRKNRNSWNPKFHSSNHRGSNTRRNGSNWDRDVWKLRKRLYGNDIGGFGCGDFRNISRRNNRSKRGGNFTDGGNRNNILGFRDRNFSSGFRRNDGLESFGGRLSSGYISN